MFIIRIYFWFIGFCDQNSSKCVKILGKYILRYLLHFMFHLLFSSLARSRILTLWSAGIAKSCRRKGFSSCWLALGLVFWLRLSGLKLREILCVSFSMKYSTFCIYHCLSRFPVRHLTHPIISTFVFLLSQFASFAYVICYFNDISPYSSTDPIC